MISSGVMEELVRLRVSRHYYEISFLVIDEINDRFRREQVVLHLTL